MKEHYLARTVTGLMGIGLIGYAIWLWIQQVDVTGTGNVLHTTIALAIVVFLGVYLLTLVTRPTLVPSNRWGLALLGVLTLVMAHMFLVDTPEKYLYLRDILKVIGAFLVVTGPMKLLLTKEAEEKKFMEEVEIIEV